MRVRMALLGSQAIEPRCFAVILRDTLAIVIHHPKVGLRVRIALFS